MNPGFWAKLKKDRSDLGEPLVVLAPMANVTDAAFRRIISHYGKPDVMWTEFVSVEGLLSRGREALLLDFWYGEAERPIVAQIFGGRPEQFREVAKLCKELKFDGIDINMGCPDAGVEKSGGGAALIKDPKRAQEIIRAAQEGAGGLPVSVKTRIGYNKDEIDTWIPALLEMGLAALTVHLRTRKEMSFVPARWEEMPRIKALRDKLAPETLLLGNGDILTVADARARAKQYGIDGVMIGRGIFGNPFLFAKQKRPAKPGEVGQAYIPTTEEKLRVCLEHTKLFVEMYGPSRVTSVPAVIPEATSGIQYLDPRVKPEDDNQKWLKHFDIMKKHYKAYINGFDGAKELRVKLMEVKTVEEVEAILKAF